MSEDSVRRDRSDGRKPVTIYLQPDLIKQLKLEALNGNTHVYLLIEQMVKDWKAQRAQTP